MNREDIIAFARKIIINGLNSGLSAFKIEENFLSFINYLKNQNFIDKDTLEELDVIKKTIPNLCNLASMYGNDNIAEIFSNKLKPSHSSVTTTFGGYAWRPAKNTCGDDVYTYSECGIPVKDSCGDVDYTYSECGVPIKDGCGDISEDYSSDECGRGPVLRGNC